TQTAFLSSARDPVGLLDALISGKDLMKQSTSAHLQLVTKLASLAGASASDRELAGALHLLGDKDSPGPWKTALRSGLGQGLQNSQRSLEKVWTYPPRELEKAVAVASIFFRQAGMKSSQKIATNERLDAVALLGFGPFAIAADALPKLLVPQEPQE